MAFRQVSDGCSSSPRRLTVSKGCRLFSDIVSLSVALQYKIELGHAGLIDGSPEAPRRRRLEVLHKLQRSWRTPSFSIPVYGYLQHTYSVLSCGIMAQLVAADTIELSLLPSSLRGQLKPLLWKTITVPNVSNIMCFYVDPAQDLLVIQDSMSEPTYHGSVFCYLFYIFASDTPQGEHICVHWK